MKTYFPIVFEKIDSIHKAIIACAVVVCVRQNFEKIDDVSRQHKVEVKDYIYNINYKNSSKLAEHGLTAETICSKRFWKICERALEKIRILLWNIKTVF